MMRQRGAVKHKVKKVPFEILPVSLYSLKRLGIGIDKNENKISPLIKHSERENDSRKVHVDASVVWSPSVSASRVLNESRQEKIYKYNNEFPETRSLISKQKHHKLSTASFARRTGSPASKPPPRISAGPTPLKEQLLNDNIVNASIKRPLQNKFPSPNIKRSGKSHVGEIQSEKIVKRQKIYESPSKYQRHHSDSDREEYSDTENDDHDDSYDEAKTKVPITVHKFFGRSTSSINEIDVVSQVVLELLKYLRRKTESTYAKKVIHAFEEEVAVKFLEMTDILDNYLVLDRAVRKSARNIAHLRNSLFTVRKARNDIAVKIRHLRQRYNDTNNENQALKSIRNFIEEIEILNNKIPSNAQHAEKIGIVSLLYSISSFMTESWGILERLTAFNAFLAKVDKALS
ncbi:hypothetical protein PCANB_000816 [Pneumocystis canis]|nr:hypothetical protein PCANB_000816 [Pneumocystis canis]